MKKLFVGATIESRDDGVCDFCHESDKKTVVKRLKTFVCYWDYKTRYNWRMTEVVRDRELKTEHPLVRFDICGDCARQISKAI